jgi:hypothetical protein
VHLGGRPLSARTPRVYSDVGPCVRGRTLSARVVTRPDVHVSVRRTSGRVRQPHGRPPLYPADGMADGHPTAGWHAVRHPTRRTAWRTATQPLVARSDRRLDGGRPLRPPVGVAVGLADPSARGRPPGAVRQRPSAQPKLWSPITIDLEVRFKRVIPFWNVQVMLYNMGY